MGNGVTTTEIGVKLSYDARGRRVLTHPEADSITKEALIERARAMTPALRERSARQEDLGQLDPETFDDFVHAGFFRTCQPKRFGGFELGLDALEAILVEIGRGDASAAWNLGILTGHAWWASMFPEEGQEDIFGEDGHALLPTGIFGRGGIAKKVEGGYLLTGKWLYQSGIDVANWLGVGAVVEGEPGPGMSFIVQRAAGTLIEDWDMMGMRATGSKSVTLENVFVPERRAISLAAMEAQELPGSKVHPNPLYSTPLFAYISIEVTGTAVGVALHAVDVLDEIARTKPIRRRDGGPAGFEMEQAHIRRRLGEAKSLAQAAKALLLSEAERLMALVRDYAPRGQKMSREEIAEVTLRQARVIELSVRAVDEVFTVAGTTATKNGHALERCFRDVHTIATHQVLRFDVAAEAWAQVHFGLGLGQTTSGPPQGG